MPTRKDLWVDFQTLLFNFRVFSSHYVKQVCELYYYASVVTAPEVVALRVAEDVAEAVVIPPLEQEVAHLWVGILYAKAPGNAIVELALYVKRILHGVPERPNTV